MSQASGVIVCGVCSSSCTSIAMMRPTGLSSYFNVSYHISSASLGCGLHLDQKKIWHKEQCAGVHTVLSGQEEF